VQDDRRLLSFCLRTMLRISLTWSAGSVFIELLRLSHIESSVSAICGSSRRQPKLGIARATGFVLVDGLCEAPNTILLRHLIVWIAKCKCFVIISDVQPSGHWHMR
jgi:hypothetical protein